MLLADNYSEQYIILWRTTPMADKTGIRKILIVIPLLLTITGCANFNVSNSTKDMAKTTLCSTANVTISGLKAGGQASKTAASLIADNTTDKNISEIAKKVKNGNTDKELTDKLAAHLTKTCK